MEYTSPPDFLPFDSCRPSLESSCSSFDSVDLNSFLGSIEGIDLASTFTLAHTSSPVLDWEPVLDWATNDLGLFPSPAETPFTFTGCGNGQSVLWGKPPVIEHNRDAQHNPVTQFSYTTLSSSNVQSYRNSIDITSHDISSPPSLSMSSMSSSESSSYSWDSTQLPSRKRQGKSSKRPTTRSSLPAISGQKLDVLRNALFCNPKPTADQSLFLAKCLHVDESVLQLWQKALLADEISTLKGPKPRKSLKVSRVASWKQKIISQGLQKVKSPSSYQVEFLAAGLRIKVEQLWQSFRETVNSGTLVEAKSRGRIKTELPPATDLSKELSPRSDDEVQPVDSRMETSTKFDDSPIVFLPSKPSTVGVNSSDSGPWVPLIESETKPVNPVDVGDAKLQDCQHLQSIVDKIESVPDCKPSVEQTPGEVETLAMSNVSDTDMESVDEEKVIDLSPEEELAALLGPEYGGLAESILSRFAAASVWDQWQFASGFRQNAGGVGNTPSSNSSHTPGNTSSPNTSASGSSGGKRKSSGGGGEGPDDHLEPNDGDGNMHPPPPKKVKTTQLRYDCPIFRKSLGTESTVRSCALNGLEFRNLWDHLRKAHYGCEACGLKLDAKRADKTHLREREKDASICHANMRTGPTFDIGIDKFAELEEIYDNRTLSPIDKWKQWWKLLFPDAGEAPDPRHHDTISISTADIPAFQESFYNMWRENQVLPALDEIQLQAVSTLLERLLRTAPIIQRYRHQSMQPRTPRTPAAATNMQAVAYTAGQSPSYVANSQEPDFTWSTLADLDFTSDGQVLPGSGNLSFGSSASNSSS